MAKTLAHISKELVGRRGRQNGKERRLASRLRLGAGLYKRITSLLPTWALIQARFQVEEGQQDWSKTKLSTRGRKSELRRRDAQVLGGERALGRF